MEAASYCAWYRFASVVTLRKILAIAGCSEIAAIRCEALSPKSAEAVRAGTATGQSGPPPPGPHGGLKYSVAY